MSNSEFEKAVQQKMGELTFTPSAGLWDKVEAGLPPEKKRRRFIFLLLPLVMVLCGIFFWQNQPDQKQTHTATKIIEQTQNKNTAASVQQQSKILQCKDSTAVNTTTVESGSIEKRSVPSKIKMGTKARTAMQIKNAIAETDDGGDDRVTKNKNQRNLKARTKATITAVAADEDTATSKNTALLQTESSNDVNDTVKRKVKASITATTFTQKKDTLPQLSKTTEKEKKKNQPHWQWGWDAGMGISGINNTNGKRANNASSSVGAGAGGVPPLMAGVSAFKTGFAFHAGVYAQKSITPSLNFKTVIGYNFMSSFMRVGERVDTNAQYISGAYTATADHYYRLGNSTAYLNQYHYIAIPLLLQWHSSTSLPLNIEAGPALSWLLHSNALVYEANSQAYYSDKRRFNPFAFSLQAGLSVGLTKKKTDPASIGFRFSYALNSAVKKDFGKQLPFSTSLTLHIPFKK
ncbi:MAG: PorT family protein [Bacteroidetes bacterium]|nr:PorT family protein [Bacteroidota bacterium]